MNPTSTMMKRCGTLIALLWASSAGANEQWLRDAKTLDGSGLYFKAARYAFAAASADSGLAPEAHAQVALSLIHAHLENAASYFFIRTLQSGNRSAIRKVLVETQTLIDAVGVDLLRDYLIRHTQLDDYDSKNRNAYLYALAREAILQGQEQKAVDLIRSMSSESPLWPYALEIRASAYAILGKGDLAIADFKLCQDRAKSLSFKAGSDLQERCLAGQARTYYQLDQMDEADQTYDRISKNSFVWPEILFEQAWTAFSRAEYNRALGKLVSYKSPALKFVFNTEVDVLRAQSFLALCLHEDANRVIQEFNDKYAPTGIAIKEFVEKNAQSSDAFYKVGKGALQASLYQSAGVVQVLNRFVRTPYFQTLVQSEKELEGELAAARLFSKNMTDGAQAPGKGFPGFIEQVLNWRQGSIRSLGGAFVKNSLIDYHQTLLADFDKMAFIKLEMLKIAKEDLLSSKSVEGVSERARGNVVPKRRDYQYYWSFNGEFWNDELGDYIFGLESRCRGTK